MARRTSPQEQFEDEQPKRGLFWLLFRMPGATLLWLQYMFPAKGDVWGSARRYRNPGAEFLCTMMLYGCLALMAYFLSQGHERPSHGSETEAVAADALYSDEVPEPAPAGDVIVAAPEPPPEPVSDEAPTYAPPDAEELAASPPEDPPY
ncbi:hypothetical protein [Phenylobacterium sp.]|uniref:hypothetical protein n=1 Tax=Phenylobacterium sp. TaxID=1871053 RepID=UPI0035B31CF0